MVSDVSQNRQFSLEILRLHLKLSFAYKFWPKIWDMVNYKNAVQIFQRLEEPPSNTLETVTFQSQETQKAFHNSELNKLSFEVICKMTKCVWR